MLCDRIEVLRNSRESDKILPNLADRMTAGKLLDKVEDGCAIKLPGNPKPQCAGLKQKVGEMCIVGSDVIGLFP